MTQEYCRQLASRKRLEMARTGRGKGGYALVVVDSLPTQYLEEVKAKLGDGDEILAAGWFRENYERDQAAAELSQTKSEHAALLDTLAETESKLATAKDELARIAARIGG